MDDKQLTLYDWVHKINQSPTVKFDCDNENLAIENKSLENSDKQNSNSEIFIDSASLNVNWFLERNTSKQVSFQTSYTCCTALATYRSETVKNVSLTVITKYEETEADEEKSKAIVQKQRVQKKRNEKEKKERKKVSFEHPINTHFPNPKSFENREQKKTEQKRKEKKKKLKPKREKELSKFDDPNDMQNNNVENNDKKINEVDVNFAISSINRYYNKFLSLYMQLKSIEDYSEGEMHDFTEAGLLKFSNLDDENKRKKNKTNEIKKNKNFEKMKFQNKTKTNSVEIPLQQQETNRHSSFRSDECACSVEYSKSEELDLKEYSRPNEERLKPVKMKKAHKIVLAKRNKMLNNPKLVENKIKLSAHFGLKRLLNDIRYNFNKKYGVGRISTQADKMSTFWRAKSESRISSSRGPGDGLGVFLGGSNQIPWPSYINSWNNNYHNQCCFQPLSDCFGLHR